MAVDVSVSLQYVEDEYYTTPKGSIYVIGGVGGGGGGGGFIPGNYYTRTELQAGALDDLYVDEIGSTPGSVQITGSPYLSAQTEQGSLVISSAFK